MIVKINGASPLVTGGQIINSNAILQLPFTDQRELLSIHTVTQVFDSSSATYFDIRGYVRFFLQNAAGTDLDFTFPNLNVLGGFNFTQVTSPNVAVFYMPTNTQTEWNLPESNVLINGRQRILIDWSSVSFPAIGAAGGTTHMQVMLRFRNPGVGNKYGVGR